MGFGQRVEGRLDENLSAGLVSCSSKFVGTAEFRQPGVSDMELLAASERQQLDDDGYLVLESIVRPNHVRAMRDRLEELLLVTEQEHRGTLIVGGLLEEEIFDAAWLHPRVLAAVRHVLGDGVRLT